MSAQVQRKLEFQVRKSTRSQTQKSTGTPQSTPSKNTKTISCQKNTPRSARRSARNKHKENEDDQTLAPSSLKASPRKRTSDNEENVPQYNTPSPSKKKKGSGPVAQRRDETPVRGSLALKLAAAKITDDAVKQVNENDVPTAVRCPLSPIKVNGLQKCTLSSPVKSPLKLNTLERTLSPMKLNLQQRFAPSSPVKSPRKIEIPDTTLLSSPVKSPWKLSVLQSSPKKSPRKLNFLQRTDLSSPVKSPRKMKVESPSKKSPLKSPSLKLGKLDCAAYHKAKQMFHTAKPERLVGRDKEMAEVRAFLKGHMTKKTAGSLYISGAPGTGKTAVLTNIIDEMKVHHSCKTVYLNCMTLDNSAAVYGKLYTDITGKNAPTAKERLRTVERVLTTEGPSIIMVLDEIDQLDSKNQEILYTIFEWPSLQKSRLILVGIANALDLTDRVLPRLQARPDCKPKLLNFAPYTKDQIATIIKDRIRDLENAGTAVMDATAIQFCARKISAVAGDMRKALDVCRRAVELVETDVKSQRVLKPSESTCSSPSKRSPQVPKKISVVHINNVLSDVYGSGSAAQQQETIPLQQKLIACSLLLMLKQGKMKEVPAGKLHEIYCKVCKNRQMAAIDQSEFQGVITLLESRGMIGIKKAKETRMNKVTLKLDERELEHTMQDKVLVSTILKEGLPK
ncbi:cell division control protein 6 homolog isoform X2 [Mercenaria mercenaria]|uniref:cell division control protein 6 homolog isoform X2 n=1 Tax=Mercenaria mercenaria TaxID=6596 RepID=UPI00234F233E|nr:cell division control protein 6 homolog isoform X2 [Mercenaria mercenaria]